MAKSFQNNNKKIIAYFLCGLLILSVFFTTSGCSSDTLDYKPAQVKAFSKTTLANLYQAFSKDTKKSKAHLKAKTAIIKVLFQLVL